MMKSALPLGVLDKMKSALKLPMLGQYEEGTKSASAGTRLRGH